MVTVRDLTNRLNGCTKTQELLTEVDKVLNELNVSEFSIYNDDVIITRKDIGLLKLLKGVLEVRINKNNVF